MAETVLKLGEVSYQPKSYQMNSLESRNRIISLTVIGLTNSVREILLSLRHGEIDELDGNHREDLAHVYRLMETQLKAQEQGAAAIVFAYRGVTFRLSPYRFYEYCGMLCRFVYLRKPYREARPAGPTPTEIESLQLAGWVCSKHYQSGPKGLRLIYTALADEAYGPASFDRQVLDLDCANDALIEHNLMEKLDRTLEHIETSDRLLPDCTIEERHGTGWNQWRKCRDYCRARHVCSQYAAARALVALPVAAEGPLF